MRAEQVVLPQMVQMEATLYSVPSHRQAEAAVVKVEVLTAWLAVQAEAAVQQEHQAEQVLQIKATQVVQFRAALRVRAEAAAARVLSERQFLEVVAVQQAARESVHQSI